MELTDKFEYRPGRWLRAGDRVKVRGGPVYITEDGRELLLGRDNHGKHTFLGTFEDRAPRRRKPDLFIMLLGGGRTFFIPAVPRRSRHSLDNYVPRPYKLSRPRVQATARPKRRRKSKGSDA